VWGKKIWRDLSSLYILSSFGAYYGKKTG